MFIHQTDTVTFVRIIQKVTVPLRSEMSFCKMRENKMFCYQFIMLLFCRRTDGRLMSACSHSNSSVLFWFFFFCTMLISFAELKEQF